MGESEIERESSPVKEDQHLPQSHAISITDPSASWNAAYDHTSQKWYYYNLATGERSWDPPPGWISNNATEIAPAAAGGAVGIDGYYYKDAHGVEQGPFSIQQLLAWRGTLPMDLPLWKIDKQNSEKEEERENAEDGGGEAIIKKECLPLAHVLGDAELLDQWRAAHPEITETVCAAPSAATFENELLLQQQKQTTLPNNNNNNNNESNDKNTGDDKIDFAASLAEAVLAGLPPDDEAVQLSRVAASAGQSLQEVVDFSRKQKAEVDGYAVTATHTSGRGRIQAVGAEQESLYADMGAWINPHSMDQQMKKAKESTKRKLTAEEVKAMKSKTAEKKAKKLRAWLQD